MKDAALLREACTLLGVDRCASVEQVRAAWKRRLKEVHPDVGGSKEAVQHATNMRDVLVAWIEAGRPNLEPAPEPVSRFARSRFWTRDWEDVGPPDPADVPQPQPIFSWDGFWIVAGIWVVCLLVSLASHSPRRDYRPTSSYQSQFTTSEYSLPLCVREIDVADILKRICGPALPRMQQGETPTAVNDLPGCASVDPLAEIKAIIEDQCWPSPRR